MSTDTSFVPELETKTPPSGCDAVKPTVLVLGPGGIKGITLIGALFLLEYKNLLTNIHTIVGVSVGSLIGLILSLEYNIIDLITIALSSTDILDFKNPDIVIKEILSSGGLLDNGILRKKLNVIVAKKTGNPNTTLAELYAISKKKLEIVTCKISTNPSESNTPTKAVYLSHLTHPNLSCVDAVLMSCNLPFIFRPMKYHDGLYVDGGLVDPYPAKRYATENNLVLALTIAGSTNFVDAKGELILPAFAMTILTAPMRELVLLKDVLHPQIKHLRIKTKVTDTIGLTTKEDQKVDMFLEGFYQCNQFLETKPFSV